MSETWIITSNVVGRSLEDAMEALVYRLAKASQNINKFVAHPSITYEYDDILRSKNGDHRAYRRLVESHQDYVGRLMWRFSRDKQVHEELVQDVFVEAYLSLDSFRLKAPFSHWLATIGTRVGYAYWKKTAANKRTEQLSLQDWDQVAAIADYSQNASQAGELLYKLLGQLAPRDRLVLTLRYLEDCDVAETAKRTGWTRTMVKVQTLRARIKLRKLFLKSERKLNNGF
jgi:RNA polymerase sigma-70 factor (ECF subfamily)